MGDYVTFEPIAHWFGSGSREEVLWALLDDLQALKAKVDRRADLLTKLTRAGKCREGKVTPELAKIKSFGLHPILVLLDECHLAFDTGKGKAGALGEERSEGGWSRDGHRRARQARRPPCHGSTTPLTPRQHRA